MSSGYERHLQQAWYLFGCDRHRDAIAAAQRALALEPESADCFTIMALAHDQLEEYDAAERCAREAVLREPGESSTHRALAIVLFDRSDPDAAQAAIQQAIRLDPQEVQSFAVLGQVHLVKQQWGKALAAADQGLTFDPAHEGCLNVRTQALLHLGRLDEARLTVGGVLAENPENAFSHANLAWVELHSGRHERALQHFSEALRHDPSLDWARVGLVEALKAKYRVFRVVLAFQLWLTRMSPRARWGLIIGAYVLFHIVREVERRTPEWSFVLRPIGFAYIGFVYMTWTADSYFEMLLAFNRFGRRSMDRDQLVGAVATGVCVAIALLGATLGLCGVGDAWYAALITLLLVVPIGGTAATTEGWPRSVALIVTSVLALLMLLGIIRSVTHGAPIPGDALLALSLAGLGSALSTWVFPFLVRARPKR